MDLNQLLQKAPAKTAIKEFRGLFGLEILLTSKELSRNALEEATKSEFDAGLNSSKEVLDQERLDGFLASRVVGFRDLTVKKAMTLCGHDVPEDLAGKADELLPYSPETMLTLLACVTGLSNWLMKQMSTLAQEVARREEAARGN